MKRAILVVFLISFTIGYANESKNPNSIDKIMTVKELYSISEIKTLDFTVDTLINNTNNNIAEKVEFQNLYNRVNLQIFSNKKGRMFYRNRYVEYVISRKRNVLC